ncbi:hypothetical protein ASD39_05790 [Sphingomonas sp. Root50]|nr:hypothetical protein ASD17_03270 [Sphingomonas sp. Root1294]KQY68191.1 hypothetical protein ASD39_05790 [Sphingomonas sp. Root50]
MAVEDDRVIGELVRIGRVRQEAVEEHRLGMATDLGVGEQAVDGAVAQLGIAELVIVEPVARGALALGDLDGGAGLPGGPAIGRRIDARVAQHQGDARVHALLVAEPRGRLGEGNELAAEPAGIEVDLGAVVHQALGLRVDGVEMVDLGEGVHPALPVGAPVRAAVLDHIHLVDVVEFELRQDRREPLLERLDVGVHRYEHQPHRHLAAHRGHVAIVAQYLGAEGLGIGNGDILAVQGELPAVERAGEAGDAAEIVEHQPAATMRADIVMGMDRAIRAAHDDEAFAADVEAGEVALLGNVRQRAGDEPALREDLLPLLRGEGRVVVAGRRRPRGAVVDIAVRVEWVLGPNVNVPQPKIVVHHVSPRFRRRGSTCIKKHA